jgi:opacity protein-like surface antigen
MKGWLAAFILITALSTSVAAQDSTMPSQSEETHSSTMAQQGDAPMAQPANAGSMPASGASAPQSTHKAYGSEGYGGRAEIFLSGFALVGSQANGNAITEQQTDAGGLAVGYRFHLNSSSALEGRYGFSRNSDKYTIGGTVSSIPSYFSEISGSYVYTFSKSQHIRPFLEAGGGAVIFIPGNYNTPSSTTTVGTSSGVPSGYALPTFQARDVAAPVYSGSSAGVGTQARGMFLYGGGLEIPVSSHFYFRTEFRGLGYEAPDFKLSPLHTSALSFTYEPAFAVAYRF